MDILLTGGTGFIGSYVAMELIRHGHAVVILVRNENKIPQLKKIKWITIVQGDISDMQLLKYTKQTAWEIPQDDTLPTVHISDIAARAHVKHFIYTVRCLRHEK